jgi:hypothetical protein
MSSILKLYLKIFLLFVFCYGTINLIYYFFDTSYFDLKDVYQIFIFGFFMSFTLVSLHLFCLKQMKIKDFSSSNLSVIQLKIITSNLNQEDLFQKITSHPLLRNMKHIKTENGLKIHTSLNWKTWGEIIEITCISHNNVGTVCNVKSKPKLITTILDYGKSLENLNMIENIIKN